jgi:galactokinase
MTLGSTDQMRHSNTRLEHGSGGDRSVQAFAPGRVNLIGEHTDYNDGLCLPFAVERGVTVSATPIDGGSDVEVEAGDLAETDRFPLADPPPAEGWRAYVRGAVAELQGAGVELRPCRIEITSDLPARAGLSSSAALTVATCLALWPESDDPIELARLCSRVENDWTGAQTGLLDQLAVLCSRAGQAIRIDMRGPEIRPVPLNLGGHRLATLDSGAERSLAKSGYNERRDECRAAARQLGLDSLRDATSGEGLPDPLDRRVRHVISENERVDAAEQALINEDFVELGRLLDASHASLRDDYEVSTPEVERAVEACREAGALGARIMGGGFGGSVLALFPPGRQPPPAAVAVMPGPAARARPR